MSDTEYAEAIAAFGERLAVVFGEETDGLVEDGFDVHEARAIGVTALVRVLAVLARLLSLDHGALAGGLIRELRDERPLPRAVLH